MLILFALGALAACAPRAPRERVPFPVGPPPPYRLKVGDVLAIRFYKTPELNAEVPIRSDGRISLDLIGDVQAAGLEPDVLARTLTDRYASELSAPNVAVIVRSFGGQVFVGGEVKTPSAVPFATGLTVLQAIDGAGGFLDTAEPDSVVLIRRETDRWQGYRVELADLLAGEDGTRNVALQPDDLVHVPRSRVANMNLFVEQYIRNNLPIQPSLAVAPGL